MPLQHQMVSDRYAYSRNKNIVFINHKLHVTDVLGGARITFTVMV